MRKILLFFELKLFVTILACIRLFSCVDSFIILWGLIKPFVTIIARIWLRFYNFERHESLYFLSLCEITSEARDLL